MSEQNKVEDVINETLTGDRQKNALDFVSFLKTNDFSLDWDGNWWGIHYKGSCPALFGVKNDDRHDGVSILFNYVNFACKYISDDDLKSISWAKIQYCHNFKTGGKECGCGDEPGKSITLFGKNIHNTCQCPLQFWDPDYKTLENIKKLMLMHKNGVEKQRT